MPLNTGVIIDGFLTFANDLTSITARPMATSTTSLAQGTSASQADLMFADTRTLTTGAADSLDLYGGLTNVFGASLSFVKVKGIYIKASTANTTVLTIGNGTNPFTGPLGAAAHTVALSAGGELYVTDPVTGWTVTGSTADILKITNASGASASYDIIAWGCSA